MVLRSTPRRLATPSMPRPLDRTAARSRSLVMWIPERTTWDELTVQQLPQEIQHRCCPVPARGRSLNLRLGGSWRRDERGPRFQQEGLSLKLLIDASICTCPYPRRKPVSGGSGLRFLSREGR